MKIQTPRHFLARLAARRASRTLPLTVALAALVAGSTAQAANALHTILSGASGNVSDSTQYSAGGPPSAGTAGDILQDSTASGPGAFTLALDVPVTIGTIKLNTGGGHSGTFNGPNAFTLDNTGGTTANIFGNTDASIGQNANAGTLTINANIVAANSTLDIGSTQFGNVVIAGNITASTATTLYLRQNATQNSSTTTDSISGNIGASGSAIAINNASSGGGGGTRDIFSLSGAIGGAVGTGAAVTITNAATGSAPFNISGALGATVSNLTQNSATSTMTISGANSAFVGTTSIQTGTLTVSSATGLGTSAVTLSNTAGAILNTTISTSIGSLAGGGTAGGNVTTGTTTLTVGSDNTSTSYAGAITGTTGGLTKIGAGTLTLSGASTYTGTTTVSNGALKLDFTASGAPAANILGNTTAGALSLGGGTLQVVGASGGSSQTFASLTITAGSSMISATSSSGTIPTVALGAFAANQGPGATVQFVGPATVNAAGNVPATATITTTTAGTGTFGNVGTFGVGKTGAYATVGLYDYASTDTTAGAVGTSPYTVIGGSQVSGFYQSTGITTTTAVYDVPATGGVNTLGNAAGAPAVRFNNNAAQTLTFNATTANGIQGFLVTPKVGAFDTTITGGGLEFVRSTTLTGTYGVLWQNNTQGYLNFNSVISGGGGTRNTNGLVQAGPGTVVYGGVNTYELATYLNGGYSVVTADSGFGAVANASAVNLNGGTVVGNATFTMDNAGANPRPFSLGSTGGGLAATTGNTMTINGVVSGVGALTIGFSQLAGSGSGTAHTTAVVGDGTVVLTGANSYTGLTTISAGTLNINGVNALGGGNYAGLTINGGTLQYAAGATGNGSLDVSNIGGVAKPVTFGVNGATVDTNGNAVTFANPVGNNGAGSLTVKSSTAGGVLTLAAANTYTGGTVVTTGALTLTANGTLGTGNVTLANTTGVLLTLGNNAAIADTATLTFGTNSAISMNAAGTEILGAVTDSSTGVTLNAGNAVQSTYSASDLNSFFGVTSFTGTENFGFVAVPEPGTCFAGALLVGVAGWSLRRRFAAGRTAATV